MIFQLSFHGAKLSTAGYLVGNIGTEADSMSATGPSATFTRATGESAHGGKADVTATYRDVAV